MLCCSACHPLLDLALDAATSLGTRSRVLACSGITFGLVPYPRMSSVYPAVCGWCLLIQPFTWQSCGMSRLSSQVCHQLLLLFNNILSISWYFEVFMESSLDSICHDALFLLLHRSKFQNLELAVVCKDSFVIHSIHWIWTGLLSISVVNFFVVFLVLFYC